MNVHFKRCYISTTTTKYVNDFECCCFKRHLEIQKNVFKRFFLSYLDFQSFHLERTCECCERVENIQTDSGRWRIDGMF